MRALGLDLGARRVGVAISDSAGRVASPCEVIERRGPGPEGWGQDHAAIAALVQEWGVELVVAGLPISLDGTERRAAQSVRAELEQLGRLLAVPIQTVDERFTTAEAHKSMQAGGTKSRQRRGRVDQVAAAILLQAWLDANQGD
ncbi:MAG: Holliday junction resolvase RuvX [Acidimicrobiales bacterium]